MQAKEKFYLQLQDSYAQACSDLMGTGRGSIEWSVHENNWRKISDLPRNVIIGNCENFHKNQPWHHPRTLPSVVKALNSEQLSLNFLKDVHDAAKDVNSTCVPYPTMVWRFEAISLSSLFFMNFHFVVKRPDISSWRLWRGMKSVNEQKQCERWEEIRRDGKAHSVV